MYALHYPIASIWTQKIAQEARMVSTSDDTGVDDLRKVSLIQSPGANENPVEDLEFLGLTQAPAATERRKHM